MAKIVFFEKPGCINNTKQKQWLEAAGHELEVFSILEYPWTAETLRSFLPGADSSLWFNRTAPVIKNGELDPDSFSAAAAVDAMLVTPLLIKRPLIQIGDVKMQGFDKEAIAKIVSLEATAGNEETVAKLDADNLTLCPNLVKKTQCD
jgi:nitrogenase-associated protein